MTGFRGISHLTKQQSQKLGPTGQRPSGSRPAVGTFLPQSCQNLNSRLTYKKIKIPPDFIWGTEAMNFEGFLITEDSEVAVSKTDVTAVGPGQATCLELKCFKEL